MNTIDPNKPRVILDDFVKEVDENKMVIKGKKLSIFFRKDKIDNNERQVYEIPIIYIKYRKDNGRIASDVYAYEQKHGELIEATDTGQQILRNFLVSKDKERTTELKSTIIDRLQDEPAVITCDGFLINGNRRKMVFEMLTEEFPAEARFRTMKVVILPGKKQKPEDEPAPTYYEIEQIESAYQFQTHGKSEYSNFDKAISIRRKQKNGMSIEEQLTYDAAFKTLPQKEKQKKIKQIEEDFLNPLKCIDQYLERLGRKGLYDTIATAKGSKKGQWQAFIDYYKYVDKNLTDPKKLQKLGISKMQRGDIQDVAFKLIRAQNIKGVDKKSHELMRLIPKMLPNKAAREELLKLKDSIKLKMHGETTTDAKDAEIKDLKWYQANASEIIYHVKNAHNYYLGRKESETPLELLIAAYGKLDNDNMKIEAIEESNLKEALKLAENVRDVADSIKKDIWQRIIKKNQV